MPDTIATSKEKLRPFKPGEFINNPDGTISTERSVTFQSKDGKWVNAPSLWMGPKGVMDFGQDEEAIADIMDFYERKAGKKFPRFDSVEQAVEEAKKRSANQGAFQGEMAR